ncbi:hypothetical protein [Ulvibacter litoralis]|uniref:Uncharacterized protein n=1 Tax=Ulvibacter litoralis TaxID=227084 RepID=A0A1G7D4G7_9FLAO|nr:hypothetical protein [Ulvibacter litoralis]SDE46478.1 hypothetical protein SAMN05421855_101767 [Ulvibacter litoralis]
MKLKNTKKLSLVLFSVGALLVYSCKEDPKTNDKTTKTETTSPAETKTKTATPIKTVDGVALNPAHGQPGHRCDISVGAPLNGSSTPVKTNTQTSDVILNNGTNNTTTLPKGTLNPAHGQPGHDCAVKVGDPL